MDMNEAVGAPTPHKLDEVFTEVADFRKAFMENRYVNAAFEAAEAAYRKQENVQQDEPGLLGTTPERAALDEWLKELGLQIDYDGMP